MANERWYPNLSGESPRVADAIRLLWDSIYNLSGQNNTAVSIENAVKIKGVVTAQNSDNPSSNELLTKQSADTLYSSAAIAKELSSSGSNPLSLSGLPGYPASSISRGLSKSKPSAGSIDGQMYYETDTAKLYSWNKSTSTWENIIAGSSGTSVHSALTNLDYASAGHTGFQAALGFTAENVANKSTSTSLGTSDTYYPSQNAVKSYVDSGLSGKQNSLGYTAENAANKSTSTSLGTSDTYYPSQNAVKTYVDAKVADSISDGVTTIAPSENAVFDALALKANLSSPTFTGTVTIPAVKITTGAGLNKVLTSDADGDATWETASSGTGWKYPMDFRLTLESGVPVSTTAQTAKTTLYLTPYIGNQISLYDGSSTWTIYNSNEMSLSLSGYTASKPYDIWCYDNSGTPTLESTVWTDATTRATALTKQDGVYVKTGATTRRYIGTIYINASGGQTDDTPGGSDAEAKRYVWNYYNRVSMGWYVYPSTGSWNYTTTSYRASNNTEAGTRVSFVIGVQEDSVSAFHMQTGDVGSTSAYVRLGIEADATTSNSQTLSICGNHTNQKHTLHCQRIQSFLGYHYLQVVEFGDTGITYYGDVGSYGFRGTIRG